jgi:23S rRNA pseudouridine2605 synthase
VVAISSAAVTSNVAAISKRGGYNQHGGGYNNIVNILDDYDPNAKYSVKKQIEYKEENIDPNEPIRLNKFLANAGVCSRREADEFIRCRRSDCQRQCGDRTWNQGVAFG